MPTQRFLKLKEEKKQAILEAAVHEFSRVPYSSASINQIIKEADISRGSFYTYFEDKWDLLGCMFEENQNRLREFCKSTLVKADGDIWIMLEGLLEESLGFCTDRDHFTFIKNVLSHTDSGELIKGFTKTDRFEHRNIEIEHWIFEHTDKKLLTVRDYNEFHCFFQLSMYNLAMEMKDYFDGMSMEDIRERFALKLNILKYGVGRRDLQD